MVDQVDLVVPHGVVFGLLGPNGAGKTTMIKMLITLLAPTTGTATIAGCDVRTDPARVRRLVGYVPQLLSADGALTAEENLLVFARLYHIPPAHRRTRIPEALASVGLTKCAKKLVLDYSGGMVRRLEIVQRVAIMHRGRVVAQGSPDELKARVGPEASLDDVFIAYRGQGREVDASPSGCR